MGWHTGVRYLNVDKITSIHVQCHLGAAYLSVVVRVYVLAADDKACPAHLGRQEPARWRISPPTTKASFNHQNMRGKKLVVALGRTKRNIEVIYLGEAKLYSPTDAITLVRDSEAFIGRGTNRNVSQILFLPPKPPVRPVVIQDSGYNCARYPMPSMSSLSLPFPALARIGAGLS